jgi:hypothetical protein
VARSEREADDAPAERKLYNLYLESVAREVLQRPRESRAQEGEVPKVEKQPRRFGNPSTHASARERRSSRDQIATAKSRSSDAPSCSRVRCIA